MTNNEGTWKVSMHVLADLAGVSPTLGYPSLPDLVTGIASLVASDSNNSRWRIKKSFSWSSPSGLVGERLRKKKQKLTQPKDRKRRAHH